MSRQFEARSQMVDWQVAPAEFEIANYDTAKIKYRKAVEEFIAAVPRKSLKKKTFITICTNVLCAEITTSKDTIDPVDRDIYLPLEISLTKWNVNDASKPSEERSLTTHFWMLDPGSPPVGCINYALSHKAKHKIEYTKLQSGKDSYVETDLQKVVKEINSILLPDRTVFSLDIRRCRQDLGCLKWLNRELGYKIRPIKVYSLEDLYVVLIRSLADDEQIKLSICQGLARHQMENTSDPYEPEIQCPYHRDKPKEDDDGVCVWCAKALGYGHTKVLLNDLSLYTDLLFKEIQGGKS